MNHRTSYTRITVMVAAAATIWFLSTFVPSPYKKDMALVPMAPVQHDSQPQPLSDVQPPAVMSIDGGISLFA